MRTIILASCVVSASLGVGLGVTGAIGAPFNNNGNAAAPAAANRPLPRDEVDRMLKQARAAIQQGDLEQAESLLSRAEGARIHYSLFHVGPTPSSVRRELNRARNANRRAGGGLPAHAKSSNGASPSGTGEIAGSHDPFLARDQAARQAAAAPAGPTLMPHDATRNANGAAGDSTQPAHQDLPALGMPVANPFASSQRTAPASVSYETPDDARYAASQAAVNPASAASDSVAAAQATMPATTAGFDSNQALPAAPLPRATKSAYALSLNQPGEIKPQRRPTNDALGSGGLTLSAAKQKALEHLSGAREALKSGNLELADELGRAASSIGVPESQFLPDEDRPSLLAWDIAQAKQNGGKTEPPATLLSAGTQHYAGPLGQTTTTPDDSKTTLPQNGGSAEPDSGDRWAMLPDPLALPSASAAASTQSPEASLPQADTIASPSGPAQQPGDSEAAQLLGAGEDALVRHDRQAAIELFEKAHGVRDQLTPAQRERLQDRLQMLAAEPVDTTVTPKMAAALPLAAADSAPLSPLADSPGSAVVPSALQSSSESLIDLADENQQVLARQLSAEVGKRQSEAQRLRDRDPDRAIAILREAQQMVDQSQLPESTRGELSSRIDITLEKTQKHIDGHRAEIDLDQRNEAILNEVERSREVKLKVQQKTAEMVDEFNRLLDEQRYAEAEIVAKRLKELSPEDPVVEQIYVQAKFIRRNMMNRDLMDKKEGSVWAQLNDVEESAINPVAESGKELQFNATHWEQFAQNRKGSSERMERRTERELEIERRLRTPVLLRYEETPLSEVMDSLSQLTGVNIHLDPRGLSQEGYNSDTPISVNLSKEVQLKSALNLILEPLHLSYVIKDEVLKITSEQLRDGEIYPMTYNVADLVIPIPNFVPSNNIGLQGLLNDAHAAMGYGRNPVGPPGPAVLVNGRRQPNSAAAPSDDILAQQFNAAPASPLAPATVPIGAGPGGMGGGANADFDSLIDLIVSTVSADTWAENGGGEAEIRPFPTNLSLVISQTQAVHEEIADLLAQLRRLQDLQVTIEVRFIRLNDRFFERIGIDFDMNIEDRTIGTADLIPGQVFEGGRQSATVGLQFPVTGVAPFPNFTADLDIPFRQESFNLAAPPPFGGAAQVSSFGFAILSDIEAFFLIEAAQGDSRTNVLNAPKVTLFNGQVAFVADSIQQPFVLGVIPVVGEFVAAQQPVIVVLNEGTMMTIQAVVSDDRRYVRLTVVPFFTQIGDVQEFTFEGSSSTTSSSSSVDDDDDGKNEEEDESEQETRTGVTVQLPAFQFVSVVTTVSVPDGGTVLLGGIKRLSEGRTEFGVPLLSKVPYINRLFRNVGIGRDTDSLMMMVTPRIIIQEEEEERLGIAVP